MHKNAFAIVILSALLGCTQRPAATPGETFDAGPVFAHATPRLTHRFLVTNTTGRKVRLLKETHSCSCTKVELAGVTLEPGASTPLVMNVDVSETYSALDLTCTVNTDHPEHPNWVYHLTFMSYPRARIDPDRINLGSFPVAGARGVDSDGLKGPGRDVWVEFYGKTGDVFPSPRRVDRKSDALIATLDPTPVVHIMDGKIRRERYRLSVTLDRKHALPGDFFDTLQVPVGNGVAPQVSVRWSCVGPFTVSPAQVHFGRIAGQDASKSVEVTIESGDGAPFKLLSCNTTPEGRSPRVSLAGGKELPSGSAAAHPLTLTFSPPSEVRSTAASGAVEVMTDRAGAAMVRIPWSVFLKRRPDATGQGGSVPLGP